MKKKSIYEDINTYMDFLLLEDHRFILWRLQPTEESDLFWENFISNHPSLIPEFYRAIAICDSICINKGYMENKSLLYQRIQSTISRKSRQQIIRMRIFRYAAAALALLLLIPLSYLGYVKHPADNNWQKELRAYMPQGQEIELTVGNQRLILQDSATVQMKDGMVGYGNEASDMNWIPTKDKPCRLAVPPGKYFHLTLADMSRVWLSSNTIVEIPPDFNTSARSIHADGEMYLEVTKNASSPFVVHTPKLDVLVKGTCFNVSAYSNEDEASVVLVNGKVQVNTQTSGIQQLSPNEQVTLERGKLSKQCVDVTYYTSWKDGYFTFNETPLFEVLRKIGKYYNIEFVGHESIIFSKRITGKLFLSRSLEDVLASISLITSMDYIHNNDQVTIKEKEDMPMK